MKKRIALAALSMLALTAQADVTESLKSWFVANAEANQFAETAVIAPGYQMGIAGQSVPVFGTQPCPRADGVHFSFFGGEPQRDSGCVVIRTNTAAVQARFILDGKAIAETWAVERGANHQTLLRRPNGDYVAQAN